MFRYLALLWDVKNENAEATVAALQRRIQSTSQTSQTWEKVLGATGVAVFVADRSKNLGAVSLFGGSGIVLGEIFGTRDWSRDFGSGGSAEFGAAETRVVVSSQGRKLARDFWGNFIAILFDPSIGAETGDRFVFKDPCGSLPCYFTVVEGVRLVFSCLGDCRDLGLRFNVNWAFVKASVLSESREVREESLTGVCRVRRGECVRFTAEGVIRSRSLYWRPPFTDATDLNTAEVALPAVRDAVMGCVRSMAAEHSSVLAQVSGGLDSSIVLGCLGELPRRPEVSCYTVFVPESVCDERRWARYAVRRGGYPHEEVALNPRELVYKELPALAASVEPGSYFEHWRRGPLQRELAGKCGATALFTGEGGDAAFCSTSYVFAIDHCLRRFGLGLRTLRTAARVATRRDRTIWNVVRKALLRRIARTGAAGHDTRRSLEPFRKLVSSDVLESEDVSAEMSLESLLRMGPLAYPSSFYDLSISPHESAPYVVSPLCAQPVVEVCARIPVDVHFDGGCIRGLARRAFANEVPAPILRRQWKDRPLLQLGEIIQLNLSFIREHLLEGKLVKQGVLDRTAVELALQGDPGRSSAIGSEVLSHLDLELWIRDCARA